MSVLNIAATKSTPQIHFDDKQDLLEIQGESYPENTPNFYAPIFAWLEEYLQQVGERAVTMNLEINYFNSSSSKVLTDLFDRLDEACRSGTPIVVNWRYHEENDMALEYGEDFQEEVEEITFNLIEFSDD
ncbi:MAG: DUF1987 domain-containing protein [Gammaproteobacteria bacterium]|nr:DUF1987 domain-containing protein [Gammaproteobacteria bacterium]